VSDAWLERLAIDECLALLRANAVGRIAFVVDDFPVVVPVNYRLVEASGHVWLAMRTRPDSVIDQAPMNVAFEVDGVDPVHREGWSVLARGTLHHVDPDAEDFGEHFELEPWIQAERDAWLIIDPFAITGRRLHGAELEWAFHIRAYL
jgi:nitroimidazol reductase NimA-like FMN-containing flavoprotein (pyridoxamine 5'-phosphate oxidase superfamily)